MSFYNAVYYSSVTTIIGAIGYFSYLTYMKLDHSTEEIRNEDGSKEKAERRIKKLSNEELRQLTISQIGNATNFKNIQEYVKESNGGILKGIFSWAGLDKETYNEFEWLFEIDNTVTYYSIYAADALLNPIDYASNYFYDSIVSAGKTLANSFLSNYFTEETIIWMIASILGLLVGIIILYYFFF